MESIRIYTEAFLHKLESNITYAKFLVTIDLLGYQNTRMKFEKAETEVHGRTESA